MSFVPQFCLHTTTLTSDAETYLPGKIAGRQFSIGAVGGFLDAGFTHQASESQLWDWVNHLGKRGTFYNTYADVCWDGLVHSVTIQLGAATVTYSLEKLINRLNVAYTPFDGLGNSGNAAQETETGWAEDLTSQAKYGIREVIHSGGELTDTAALNLRAAMLDLYGRPYPTRQIGIGSGGSGQEMSATVQLLGYWSTAAWQIYNNETDTEVSTDTQIKTIITNECPSLSTDFSQVIASGLNTWQYRYENMTAQDEILRLMGLGYGVGTPPPRLVGGVYENRKFHLSVAADTVKYRCKRQGDQIYDQYGQPVYPWDVRPDAVLEIEDLEPSGINYPAELDDPRRLYIERVAYSEPGTLAITPFGLDDLGSRITSLGLRWTGA